MPVQRSASYSLAVRLETDTRPGQVGMVATAIGEEGGEIGATDIVSVAGRRRVRDFTIACRDEVHGQQIVRAVQMIAPVFGGINPEDIAAPKCFDVEERLRTRLDIPVTHDDQHGTAVVVLAALTNSLELVGKRLEAVKVVINGVGAAGMACARILTSAGAVKVVCSDAAGALFEGRTVNMNRYKEALAEGTNPSREAGTVKLAGLPGHLPWRARRAGNRHQRRDEGGRRVSHRRAGGRRRALRGVRGAEHVRQARGRRRHRRRQAGCLGDRRGAQGEPEESTVG